MSRIIDIDVGHEEKLCAICKALSVPARVDILKLVENKGMSVGEIAEKLDIPQSSATFHIKILENADLINVEERPGRRGTLKLCTRKTDYINISAYQKISDINKYLSYEMPIGAYFDCKVAPTCGLGDAKGIIGVEDKAASFYLPERIHAGILWTSSGYLKYKFPCFLSKNCKIVKLMFTLELCSEAPNYHENWKSDITFLVNGVEIATWQSGGDYGSRRGRLNPDSWEPGSTQYGVLVGVEINETGTLLNGKRCSDVALDRLEMDGSEFVELTICNKPDAMYIGGFNLFGKTFGDYAQDLVMGIEYREY